MSPHPFTRLRLHLLALYFIAGPEPGFAEPVADGNKNQAAELRELAKQRLIIQIAHTRELQALAKQLLVVPAFDEEEAELDEATLQRIANCSKEDRITLAGMLLKGGADEFPSVQGLTELIFPDDEKLKPAKDELKAVMQHVLRFVKEHQSHLEEKDDGLSAGDWQILRALTRDAVWQTEKETGLPDSGGTANGGAGPLLEPEPFWAPVPGSEYAAGNWQVCGPVLLAEDFLDDAGTAVHVASGKTLPFPRWSSPVTMPRGVAVPAGLYAAGSIIIQSDGSAWQRIGLLPVSQRYAQLRQGGSSVYWLWDPPQHLFNEEARAADDQLKIRFGRVDGTTRRVSESRDPGLIEPDFFVDMWDTEFAGVLPSGKAVATGLPRFSTRPSRASHYQTRVLVGETPANDKFTRVCSVQDAVVRTVPVAPDRLLLLYGGGGSEPTLDEWAPVPLRLIFYDVQRRSFAPGFVRDSPALGMSKLPLEPYGTPQWKLPPELDLPPADEIENCQVILEKNEVYLFLTRRKPGQERFPRRELWRLIPGQPAPLRVSFRLPLSPAMRTKDAPADKFALSEARLLRCGDWWVFDGEPGLWRIEAARVTEAFARAAETAAKPEK